MTGRRTLLTAVALVVTLTSCGNGSDGTTTTSPATDGSTPHSGPALTMPAGRYVCVPHGELTPVRPRRDQHLDELAHDLAFDQLHDNDPAVRRSDAEVDQCASDLLVAILADPENAARGYREGSTVGPSDTVRLPSSFDAMAR